MPVLIKRLTLAATTLRGRSLDREARHPRRAVAGGLAPDRNGRINPVVDAVFTLAEAQKAHEFMAKKRPYR